MKDLFSHLLAALYPRAFSCRLSDTLILVITFTEKNSYNWASSANH